MSLVVRYVPVVTMCNYSHTLFLERLERLPTGLQYRPAERSRRQLTVGWEVLGLDKETATRIFEEEADKDFVTYRETMYGGQTTKYDKKGNIVDKDGKLVDPDNAEVDDDEEEDEGIRAMCLSAKVAVTHCLWPRDETLSFTETILSVPSAAQRRISLSHAILKRNEYKSRAKMRKYALCAWSI